MEITSTDYYKGKDIKKDQEARGREARTLHYLIAAVLTANDENLTAEQLCNLIYQINSYVPEKILPGRNLKELGL